MSAGSDLAGKGGQTGTDAYAAAQALQVAAKPRQRGGTGAAQGFDAKHPRTAKGRTGGGQFAVKQKSQRQSGGKVVKEPRTPAEIAAFQKSRGLPVTGKMDAKTRTAVRNAQTAARQDAAAAAAKGTAKGTRGTAARATSVKLGPGEYAKAGMGSPEHPDARVTNVQRTLDRLGYDVGISGVFGSELTKAVRLFQQNHRLPVTGVVDDRTRRFMEVKVARIDSGKGDHAGLTADTPATKRNRATGNVKPVTHKGATGKVAVAAARAKRQREERKRRPGGGQQATGAKASGSGTASHATRVVVEAGFEERAHPRGRDGKFVEFVHSWAKTKPWTRSVEDFKAGRVEGFEYRPDMNYAAQRSGLGGREGQPHVSVGRRGELDTTLLYHEAGHDVAHSMILDAADAAKRGEGRGVPPEVMAFHTGGSGARMMFENPFGIAPRPEEIIADAYSELVHGGLESFEDPDSAFSKPRVALLKAVQAKAKALGLPHERLFRYDRKAGGHVLIEADFDEARHPRGPDGKWIGGVGGGATGGLSQTERGVIEYLTVIREMHAPRQQRSGARYAGYEDFVLRHGKLFRHGPGESDVEFEFHATTAKQCYRNALAAAVRHPELTYVEGYAFTGVMPVHHAWLVDSDGRVHDPTWDGRTDIGKDLVYLGVPFTTEYLVKTVTKKRTDTLFDRLGGVPLDKAPTKGMLADVPGRPVPEDLIEADFTPDLHPRDRRGRWRKKLGLKRLELKGDAKLTKPQVRSRVQKVADAFVDFYGGDKVSASYEPEYLAANDTEARFRHEGELMAGLMYGANAHEKMTHPDYGVEWFRVMAHEAAHSISGVTPGPLPGFSQTVEEGAAEILSLWFWKHRGQEFDVRDAARVDGRWTKPGLESLANHVAYREWTAEVLRRAASKVGWDRGAIVDEVEAVMRGDHGDRIRWRDETTIARPPEGVGEDAVSLATWLLGDDEAVQEADYTEHLHPRGRDGKWVPLRVFEQHAEKRQKGGSFSAHSRWNAEVSKAVAHGELSPAEAEKLGLTHIDGVPIKDVKPLPTRLYHATTAVGAIHKSGGLKSRRELGGKQGLGGGSDDSISFTDSRENAEKVARQLAVVRSAASGDESFEDFERRAEKGDGAKRPFAKEFRALVKPDVLRTAKGEPEERLAPQGAQPTEAIFKQGWQPDETTRFKGPNGKPAWRRFTRVPSKEERDNARASIGIAYLKAASEAGGEPYAFFAGGNLGHLAGVKREDVGVVEVEPVEGAHGHAVGGESVPEWRAFHGSSVKLARARKLREAGFHEHDHPRGRGGKFIGKMWHGTTSRRGLGKIRPGFFATSSEDEAKDYASIDDYFDPEDQGKLHPVTVTLENPKRYQGSYPGHQSPEVLAAQTEGHDGVVIDFPDGRTWAYAFEPGSVTLGHESDEDPAWSSAVADLEELKAGGVPVRDLEIRRTAKHHGVDGAELEKWWFGRTAVSADRIAAVLADERRPMTWTEIREKLGVRADDMASAMIELDESGRIVQRMAATPMGEPLWELEDVQEASFREGLHPRGRGGRFIPKLTRKDWAGRVGDDSHITRDEHGHVDPAVLADLHGVRGERPHEHRNKQGKVWDDFVESVRTEGVKRPIFVTVNPGEQPKISEGNHRRDAAIAAGLQTVPVHIRYFGHSERDHEGWHRAPVEDEASDTPIPGRLGAGGESPMETHARELFWRLAAMTPDERDAFADSGGGVMAPVQDDVQAARDVVAGKKPAVLVLSGRKTWQKVMKAAWDELGATYQGEPVPERIADVYSTGHAREHGFQYDEDVELEAMTFGLPDAVNLIDRGSELPPDNAWRHVQVGVGLGYSDADIARFVNRKLTGDFGRALKLAREEREGRASSANPHARTGWPFDLTGGGDG